MRVLVTGATGFIGNHLCQYLLHQGYLVRATFRSPASRRKDSAIEWVEVPHIDGGTDWTRALDGVDYVVHLAGVAHRFGVSDGQLKTVFDSVNRDGTRALAEAVATSEVKRMVFVSSVAVLDSAGLEQPQSAYGRSKLDAERAMTAALGESDSDWCVLRPSMVYGPGDRGNMARLIRLINRGVPLPFAAIQNRKSMVFVGNLVTAIEAGLTSAAASRAKFAVSDECALSTPNLLRLVAACSSRRVRLFPLPIAILRGAAIVGDMAKRVTGRSIGIDSYSIDRLCGTSVFLSEEIQGRTGWQPPFTTAEGMRLTVAAMQH